MPVDQEPRAPAHGARDQIQTESPSWRERVVRGALLGLHSEAERPSPRGERAGGLGRLAGGAMLGALYAAAEQLLPLPPLETRLHTAPEAVGPDRQREPLQRRRPGVEPRELATPPTRPHPMPPPASPVSQSIRTTASRRLALGASALSFSVLADSAIEHYRGGFYNPAMYIAPSISALTLAASARDAMRPHPRRSRKALYGAATLAGLIGTSFHLYNVSKREGGWNWVNLFYGAPLAAPMGITFAGLFGLAATSVAGRARRREAPRLLGRSAGPALGLAAAAGLAGTAAEAGLLHFRGAFQDPFMYIPVTVPPLAALALGAAVLRPGGAGGRIAPALLWTTAAAGFAGMGFHAWGIHRNMGGWHNWSQMIQQGPPVPAPPSFTGMALAGLSALELVKGEAHA
jgi:hypothetical protein